MYICASKQSTPIDRSEARLAASALQVSSGANYARIWTRFVTFCVDVVQRDPLDPRSPLLWLAHLRAQRTVSASSWPWTSHSLRIGAASAMYLIGVEMARIAITGNWSSEKTISHFYIRVLSRTPQLLAAACAFFGELLPVPSHSFSSWQR